MIYVQIRLSQSLAAGIVIPVELEWFTDTESEYLIKEGFSIASKDFRKIKTFTTRKLSYLIEKEKIKPNYVSYICCSKCHELIEEPDVAFVIMDQTNNYFHEECSWFI